MRWPWQPKPIEGDAAVVIELFLTSQDNLLSLAQAFLACIDDPELVDDALREELVLLIRDLGDGVAVLREHIVV